MMRIDFSAQDIEDLHYWRFHHPHPRVQLRMEVLYLRAKGFLLKEIGKATSLSENTIRSYIRQYLHGGIDALMTLNYTGPQSDLQEHAETLKDYFEKNPPRSIPHAAAEIERLTGIKRSDTQVRKFLKKLGMKFLKSGYVPIQADPEVQQRFVNEQLDPRLKQAQRLKSAVFFVDACHLIWGVVLACLWCFRRIWVPQPSGRQRFSVLGAVDPVTQEFIGVFTTGRVTAATVCELLRKIRDRHPVLSKITVVLDNAKYQRTLGVQEEAKRQNIELLHLPPYSPNLNLIERVWKYLKKECLSSKYYSTFEEFCQVIERFLSVANPTFKKAMKSLLTAKFQIWPKPDLVASHLNPAN